MSSLITLLGSVPDDIITFVEGLFTVITFCVENWHWLLPVALTIIAIVIVGQILNFWLLLLSPIIWLIRLPSRRRKQHEDAWLKQHLADFLEEQEIHHHDHTVSMEDQRAHAHYDTPKKQV